MSAILQSVGRPVSTRCHLHVVSTEVPNALRAGTLLTVRSVGDPILRAPAGLVEIDAIQSTDIQTLIDDMVETVRAAPGVGLAAPQIGRSLRIVVMEDPAVLQERLTPEQRRERGREDPFPLTVLINPEIRLLEDGHTRFPEGCLSIPGYAALVNRAHSIEARWMDETGQTSNWIRLSGWPARILQHEVDHLDGILYIDRMVAGTFVAMEHIAQLQGPPPHVIEP